MAIFYHKLGTVSTFMFQDNEMFAGYCYSTGSNVITETPHNAHGALESVSKFGKMPFRRQRCRASNLRFEPWQSAQRTRKSPISDLDCISVLISLDFYAPPLLRKAEAAAAPCESFGFQHGLVAPDCYSPAKPARQQIQRICWSARRADCRHHKP